MAGGWVVRRAGVADMDPIRAIEQGCAEASHWSEVVWKEVLGEGGEQGHGRVCFVAESGSGVVGYAVAGYVFDVAELESVVVGAGARRQGVGRALCEAAMVWAKESMAEMMELEVRVSSGGALALYGSLGFREQGRRRGYYHDPIEDAVLMHAAL